MEMYFWDSFNNSSVEYTSKYGSNPLYPLNLLLYLKNRSKAIVISHTVARVPDRYVAR